MLLVLSYAYTKHYNAVGITLTFFTYQARDFDPNSLRAELPGTVAILESLINEGHKVYVHCTAGLGNIPSLRHNDDMHCREVCALYGGMCTLCRNFHCVEVCALYGGLPSPHGMPQGPTRDSVLLFLLPCS